MALWMCFLCGFIIQPAGSNERAQSFEAHGNRSSEDYYLATGSCRCLGTMQIGGGQSDVQGNL